MDLSKGINVLSLFDGMSCGRIALERAGIKVNKYYASEIDKHAIKVSKANYADIEHIGDVRYVNGWEFDKIDLLIGGSPCQGFSFAGKQLNFEDPRSKLFFEYVRILNELEEINPKVKFLLENVKMKKESEDVISDYLFCKPHLLNSDLVSAQNRERVYWTNISNFKKPNDKKIKLIDILEDMPEDMPEDIEIRNKSNCLRVGGQKSPFGSKQAWDNPFKYKPGAVRGRHINKATIIGRRLNNSGKREDYNKNVPITQCLEVRATNTDKSNCITTVQKDNVLTYLEPGRYLDAFNNKNWFRYYSLTELCRLQTVPENYFKNLASDYQASKMLGNGWTVDMIVEFFKYL